MKSKQINFFLLPEEVNDFSNEVGINNELIIKQPIHDLKEPYLEKVDFRRDNEFFKVIIKPKKFEAKVSFYYVDGQNYYLVDESRSEVLEYDRGGVYSQKPNELHRARFYFVRDYPDQENFSQKNQLFIDWANALIKIVKKKLNKIPGESGLYCSDKILKMFIDDKVELDSMGLKLIFKFV